MSKNTFAKNLKVLTLLALTLSVVLSSISEASAEEVELGSMTITPCSKWVHDNGFPYVKVAEQRAVLLFSYTSPQDISDSVKGCAFKAIAAAGVAAYITNPSMAKPTFDAVFIGCVGERALNLIDTSLRVISRCYW